MLLEYQRHLDSREGRNNAESLFGLAQIPSLEQIRNILDQIAASGLFVIFDRVYQALRQQGYLKSFETLVTLAAERPLQQKPPRVDEFFGSSW